MFEDIYQALHNAQTRLFEQGLDTTNIAELFRYVQDLQSRLPYPTDEETFLHLIPIRDWLFWLPALLLETSDSEMTALAILSQYHGTALAIDGLNEVTKSVHMVKMTIPPIEEMKRILSNAIASQGYNAEVQVLAELMEFPSEVAANYRRQSSRPQVRRHEPIGSYMPAPPSPYGPQNLTPGPSNDPSALSSLFTTSPSPGPSSHTVPHSPYIPITESIASSHQDTQHFMPPPNLYRHFSGESSFEEGLGLYAEDPVAYSPGYVEEPSSLYHMPSYNYSQGFVCPSELWT